MSAIWIGKRKIKGSDGTVWEYQGELDRAGLACGTGMAKNKHGQVKIGTFQSDVFEGIGVL